MAEPIAAYISQDLFLPRDFDDEFSDLLVDGKRACREALEWATTRGARSGRVAWQYVQDLAGRLGVKMEG